MLSRHEQSGLGPHEPYDSQRWGGRLTPASRGGGAPDCTTRQYSVPDWHCVEMHPNMARWPSPTSNPESSSAEAPSREASRASRAGTASSPPSPGAMTVSASDPSRSGVSEGSDVSRTSETSRASDPSAPPSRGSPRTSRTAASSGGGGPRSDGRPRSTVASPQSRTVQTHPCSLVHWQTLQPSRRVAPISHPTSGAAAPVRDVSRQPNSPPTASPTRHAQTNASFMGLSFDSGRFTRRYHGRILPKPGQRGGRKFELEPTYSRPVGARNRREHASISGWAPGARYCRCLRRLEHVVPPLNGYGERGDATSDVP